MNKLFHKRKRQLLPWWEKDASLTHSCQTLIFSYQRPTSCQELLRAAEGGTEMIVFSEPYNIRIKYDKSQMVFYSQAFVTGREVRSWTAGVEEKTRFNPRHKQKSTEGVLKGEGTKTNNKPSLHNRQLRHRSTTTLTQHHTHKASRGLIIQEGRKTQLRTIGGTRHRWKSSGKQVIKHRNYKRMWDFQNKTGTCETDRDSFSLCNFSLKKNRFDLEIQCEFACYKYCLY